MRLKNFILIVSLFWKSGGPNGEMGASLRYLSQRYSMSNPKVAGLLTDIGREASEMDFFQSFSAIKFHL